MPFKTTDKTCGLYFQIFNDQKQKIDDGNLQLTEEEFTAWAQDNIYVEELASQKLGLIRKEDE